MLNDKLLQAFIDTFYGYGNYSADYWFVGMEERGGESHDDIEKRLNAWDKRGRKELEDVVDYHREIGITDHFDEEGKLQPTWNKIIRVLLAIEYQRNRLARLNGNSCLVELRPLPSPSTNDWPYEEISRIPFLSSRENYEDHVTPKRIAQLQRRIREFEPKVIVFYSFTSQKQWTQIAGIEFDSESDGFRVARDKRSLYIITSHPATKGITNDYFHKIGLFIASEIRKR